MILGRIVVAFCLLFLAAGCNGGQGAQEAALVHGFIDACKVYASTLNGAVVAANAGAFSDAQKQQVHAIRKPIEAMCPPKGQMPTSVSQGLVTVVSGTADLVMVIKGGAP